MKENDVRLDPRRWRCERIVARREQGGAGRTGAKKSPLAAGLNLFSWRKIEETVQIMWGRKK
jgi:hypothetical protein